VRLQHSGLDRIHVAITRRCLGLDRDDAALFREGLRRYDDGTNLIAAAYNLADSTRRGTTGASSLARIGTGAVGLVIGLALLIRSLVGLIVLACGIGLVVLYIYLAAHS
jgi:hypothetical protein